MKVFDDGIKIPVEGGKTIEEFIGTKKGIDKFSVAHMIMPSGWSEPTHATKFDEIVIVIKGILTITQSGKKYKIKTGQVSWVELSKSVAFANEDKDVCEYWAICIPAYHPSRVHYPQGGRAHRI